MYLYERIIGILSYVIVLFIMCILVSKCNKKQIGKILFIYTIILSIMGFIFVPPKGADLYRLNINMQEYARLDFLSILDYTKSSTTPITILYMYFIGKTEIEGLLPAITAFIFYSNIFYIFKKTVTKYNIESKKIFIVLLFFMATGSFFEVISGIRTMLAFSIIMRSVFEEIIEEKSFIKNVIWYIIAGLIHPVGLAVVIIRIFFFMLTKQSAKSKKVRNILILLMAMALLYTVGKNYLFEMLNKITEYITLGNYSYIWEYIIGTITLIVIFEIQHFYKKYIKKEHYNIEIENIYKFSWVINIISIFLAFEYNTFHRFIILNTITILPVLLYIVKYLEDNMADKRYKNFYNIIILASLLILVIACARGNLSSLKYFELN